MTAARDRFILATMCPHCGRHDQIPRWLLPAKDSEMKVKDKNGNEYEIPDSLKAEFDVFVSQQHIPGCEPWQGMDFSKYLVKS